MASRYQTTRLLETNACTGEREFFVHEDGSKTATIVNVQDREPILRLNQVNRNRREDGWKGDLHHVATIPMPLMFELQKSGIAYDQEEFRKWLNLPENQIFRSKPGRV